MYEYAIFRITIADLGELWIFSTIIDFSFIGG